MYTLKQIPSKGKIETVFKRIVFGAHIRCPRCSSRSIRKVHTEARWRCKRCDRPFTIKSASWLRGSKLSLQQIWFLLWCWQKQIPVKQATDLTELSYPTVFSWYARFRDHIPKERVATILRGNVACDEMFTKETAIMGAKQKGTRNIMLKVLHDKHPTKAHAVDFLTQFVEAQSHLCTDGSGIYKGIGNWHKLTHAYEVHRKFEFTLTAEIEGIWGVFRTFVRRMYHHVTIYKLDDLVSEFCLRFRQDEIFESPYDYLKVCLTPRPFDL